MFFFVRYGTTTGSQYGLVAEQSQDFRQLSACFQPLGMKLTDHQAVLWLSYVIFGVNVCLICLTKPDSKYMLLNMFSFPGSNP